MPASSLSSVQVGSESAPFPLVGSSPALRQIIQLVQKIGPTEVPVLISGASGTGKGLVARALHMNSRRRDRPMVTVHCAGVYESLLESELFGSEPVVSPAPSQASRALIEVAEGGTLFIDRVSEMSASVQAKLLGVLEDGHSRPAGSIRELRADVRVLAATNRPLDPEVKANRFRQDLYYRLNVVKIELPTLQEHRQDIPELVEHLLRTRQVGPIPHRVHREAMKALVRYDWPGNVRELANVLERARMLAKDHLITLDDLPQGVVLGVPIPTNTAASPRQLRDVERRHVLEVLQEENWNKLRAASALGISRRALYRLIDKYGLSG